MKLLKDIGILLAGSITALLLVLIALIKPAIYILVLILLVQVVFW